MDDDIEWKEAVSGRDDSDSEEDEKEFNVEDEEINEWNSSIGEESEEGPNNEISDDSVNLNQTLASDTITLPTTVKNFSHRQLNLSLRRNIVSLADSSQHKPKPTYTSDNQTEAFESWIQRAIIAISPNADLILFSASSPEKITFLAKLRMEPINQYTTKQLEISQDYHEQVTSLLCLPIMSKQKTAHGLVDWTALVIGLSTGYVRFYTEQSICLLSLKFCDEPIVSLKCQTQKINTNARSETHFASIVDEFLITHRTLAVVVDGLGLYENLRIAKDEVVKSGSNYEPAYNLTTLPSILNCQKWKIEDSRDSLVLDADLMGTRRITKFDSLLSDSINFEHPAPKSYARTLAFVGRNPFMSYYRESSESSSHTYTELIGSLFSLWNKPPPTRLHLDEISKSSNLSLYDKDRLANSIVPSPDKRLAAITDDFGRVLLVDMTNFIIARVWKGYRSAQCGWSEVQRNPEKRGSPHASFLVIYAPKRGLLEVWSAQRGPRVAAFNVGKSCRLLYTGYRMFNMRAEQGQKSSSLNHISEQSYSSNCYLLNAQSETLFSIDLPYTYSLYKFGDLKSRDHLLIGELISAIQQDSEVDVISETLHRLSLVDSLQVSIQKLATNLSPTKIIPIMENLINKTMKNYDNHAGETMTNDDLSIIELSKRLIRLCSIFKDLAVPTLSNLPLPDVNQRLIEEYEEHPQEIDELAEKLGWSTSEILRYLSILSLERSYRKDHLSSPWPNMGEPLTWVEFISCFDLTRINSNYKKETRNLSKMSIRLKEFNSNFLNQDKVIKTSLFMYNSLSESYYRASELGIKQSSDAISQLTNSYNFLEPSSRLALLFLFWLTTKLCNHWKMWTFLQSQVGNISDELKVIAMSQDNDKLLIKTWQQIYNLILESDNIFSAIVATAAIRSDTLRIIKDNEKREKLECFDDELNDSSKNNPSRSSVDWECLCIDAERMSLISKQLEDVFLLNLLLRYSLDDGYLVENYVYRMPRISVANVLRGGPTTVSELVAQWASHTNVNLKIFIQPYGSNKSENEEEIVISGHPNQLYNSRTFAARSASLDKQEYARELLHHVKTSFPHSLNPDIVLLNCLWEFCRRYISNPITMDKSQLLKKAYECLSLLSDIKLRHNLASLAFKTFFQKTFERLVILVETNSTIVSARSSRLRDTITRKEFNMAEECLDDFVQFCTELSELMLQTYSQSGESNQKLDPELKSRLIVFDNWWITPDYVRSFEDSSMRLRRSSSDLSITSGCSIVTSDVAPNSLINTALSSSIILSVNTLVELNKLSNLMNLIFKLKIAKAFPISLIGEESRQILQYDLQQSPVGTATSESKSRAGSIDELRQRFSRKCIVNIVSKMTEETSEFTDEDEEANDVGADIKHSLSDRDSPLQRDIRASSTIDLKKPQADKGNVECGSKTLNSGLLDDVEGMFIKDENNESMVLFANLLSLCSEWKLNCDELYLELVFELYRCNQDKFAAQFSTRILDQQTLAIGLLKISSQRVLVLFGLSPYISGSDWRRRVDKWSIFQPNVASWLKSIQREEMKREIACLSFSDSLRLDNRAEVRKNTFGVQTFVLHALRRRSKLILESITNHLDGQAGRLAYDLLQLLESQLFDKFLATELDLSLKEEEC